MKMRHVWAVATMLGLGTITPSAQAQEFVASYGDWWVFTVLQDGGRTCYIASAPVNKTGNYSKRDDPHLMITSRATNMDEVSAYVGYPLKQGSEAKVEIDGKTYKFFTEGEHIWAYTQSDDERVVNALKKGARAKVRGISERGSFSIDTYSLKGISMAYNKMKAICQ